MCGASLAWACMPLLRQLAAFILAASALLLIAHRTRSQLGRSGAQLLKQPTTARRVPLPVFRYEDRLQSTVALAASAEAGALARQAAMTSAPAAAKGHPPFRNASTTLPSPLSPLLPALRAPLWVPTQDEAPWYWHGAGGRTARARAQLEMRKNSGYQPRDSPLLPSSDVRAVPVLTGTSAHWGSGAGGHPCGPKGCGEHGVCVAHLGRCDCGPYAWGADCSIAVVTQKICVYNDSRPWFCDKPACLRAPGESYSYSAQTAPVRCVGTPLAACPHSCHGRGSCHASTCACFEGYGGADCAAPVPTACLNNCSGRGQCHKGWCRCRPPSWGADCAYANASLSSGPRCRRRPCIYVYELPPRMNVLALKAEYDWREQILGRKFDYRTPPILHEAILRSAHRTADPTQAQLFYVPTWDFHGSWGNPEVTALLPTRASPPSCTLPTPAIVHAPPNRWCGGSGRPRAGARPIERVHPRMRPARLSPQAPTRTP